MADQFILDNFYQPTSQACITDLTPPTFSGITGLVANSNGSLTASWSAASDTATPIAYEIYIQASTAVGLFNVANRTLSTFSLSRAIFALADNSLLLNGTTYYVGVRARDPIGNVDTNTASLSAVSQGVPSTSILNAIAGIWDQLRTSHTVSGSFGEALQFKVDVDVSTRLAAASYTAPDNASITAIKAKTDNLPADPASNTQVNTRAPASTALDNTIWTNAKAAFIDAAISSRATAGAVWEELLASHTTAGTFGANAQNPPLSPTAVASAVWDALLVNYNLPGSFGANAQNPPLSPTQIASAVWDALINSYQLSGSTGEALKKASLASGGGSGCGLNVVLESSTVNVGLESSTLNIPIESSNLGVEISSSELDVTVKCD